MRPERVLVLGCGSVAQCTVPLLIRDLKIDPQRITIVDVLDNRARVADSIAAGVTYEQDQVTPENIDAFLSARAGNGDLLLDLAWNIDNPTILQWCRDHGVRYLNTSVEVWDPYIDLASTHPLDRTLYVRHMDLRRMTNAWGDNKGATSVVEHGANPGLVSHFTKQALTEIAARMLHDGIASDATTMEKALTDEDYATLAMLTGTKVIHISERDTQITDVPKQVDEFVNTWSVDGFLEEGIAPAELGWGTHEKRLPPNGYVHHGYGPCNQICIARPGMETWVRSWVPAGEIRGMVVRHGEALTISDHLTVWGDDGNPVYRPTVHYAYHPSDAAINSVLELRMRNWEMQSKQRILNDEITSGADELGVLLMGHPYRSWWTGSLLSIDQARAILPHQSATTMQVAGSIVACVTWMIANPNEGLLVPDDLPWREVLDVATPYLGTMHSAATDWDPVTTRNDLFPTFANDADLVDRDDPWQFSNFLVV
ncbi:MAG TPA: saccharopine dehydrogenase C-terminal domain-containing protein [Ilumatobacteraceae bacterium]|jgi:homospermidine synthase|nr:saccharopine dehydrogenase C-terminal domain-containing protein [Ilumatobacteraceae bacterium]